MFRQTTIALLIMATSATAQETTTAAESQSNVYQDFGGGESNTPAIGGWGGNNTAPCQRAVGAGIGQPGLGLGASIGATVEWCRDEFEARYVRNLMAMPDGKPKQAALHRACNTNGKVREALVYVGACATSKTAASATSAPLSSRVECRRQDGRIIPVTDRKTLDEYGAAAVQAACK